MHLPPAWRHEAEAERTDTGSGAADLFDRRAAFRIELMLAGLRRVENVRGIWEHDDLHAHAMCQALDLAHVGGLTQPGNMLICFFSSADGSAK